LVAKRRENIMADCEACGKKLGFFDNGTKGRCSDCTAAAVQALMDEDESDEVKAERLKEETRSREIDGIILTTETAPNLNITKRIEIVTAECAFGMNIFKDLFAGIRDIVGGRSEAVQKTMRDARKTALYELKREAHLVGANAVVGVDLDYVELSASGSMIMLVASGTAVIIEAV
jgi:uncharacterized protein YbjQ (UPF0145 family)